MNTELSSRKIDLLAYPKTQEGARSGRPACDVGMRGTQSFARADN